MVASDFGSGPMGVLIEYSRDKIALLDEQGRFTYANSALERLTGHEPASLVGDSAFEYVHPDDVPDVKAAFEGTIASERPAETTVEYRFRAADGSWVWFESRMSNATNEQLDGYVVSSRDVTDQVVAQREREEVTDRLREISAATGDVLWLFSGDWSELLFVNPAYEELYGQPVERLENDPEAFFETIHSQDRPAVREAMDRVSAGESTDMEYRVGHGDDGDGELWIWAQAEPILEDGEVVRIAGFSRDVTQRHRRERQLYVMDNLLRHNLRNDLTVILGNAQIIEEQVLEVADRTAVIRRTGEGLLETAEKEREVIEVLTGDATPGPVVVPEAVADAARVVRERYPEAVIDVSTPEEPARATAHALDELRAVVVELLENSIRHSRGDRPVAEVAVAVSPDGETVALVVADEAPAIPDAEAAVLRGDHEMDDIYHSSGLGLWLVYWVVELSDGDLFVSPDDGANTVRIELPRHRE
jgi:PAS domain S-box-containing protein